MQLSDKIKIIRKARGLSQEGLGYSLSRVSKNGLSRQAISDWETGKSEPCLDNIRDLANVLGVSFDALLDESIDLNDTKILNAVLNKQIYIDLPERAGEMGKSIYYSIYTNDLTIKKFKWTITFGIFVILTIIFVIVSLYVKNLPNLFFIIDYILGATTLMLITPLLIIEIIPAIKGKVVNRVGSISYLYLKIEDKYIKMENYENIGNDLSIETEDILEIKLGQKQKRRYGDVEIIIKNRDCPLTILDVMNPNELIAIFKKIKIELESRN